MATLHGRFDELRRRGRKALIPFVMGGDPNLATLPDLLRALQDAGADVIEVGLPFSDPLADGPVIQAATARALARGATPLRVLEAIAAARRRLEVPVVVLTYWNPVLQFGASPTAAHPNGSSPAAAFFHAAAAHGVSGVIVPDLPVEESAAMRRAARAESVDTVFLATPASPGARLRAVAQASTGFIYYVSVTGTTGIRRTLPARLAHGVRQLKLLTTKPVCVGFGISTPAQAAAVAKISDGVIVGSALIHRMAQAGGPGQQRAAAADFVRQLRREVR